MTARRRQQLLAGTFLLAMTISQVVLLPRLAPYLRRGYQNFTIFYGAARMVHDGQTSQLYDLDAQYKAQREFAPDVTIRLAALPFNHPAFEALLFVPFALLPYWPAYLLWTLLNLILWATSLFLLRKHFAEIRRLPPLLVALAATAFSPTVSSIIQGHDCVLLLCTYVLAWVAFQKSDDITCGALLGAGLFRFQLMVPLIVILTVRRWRLLIGFVPVAAVLTGISIAMIGWHGAIQYVRMVLSLEQTGAGGSIVAAGMPNLRGMIAGIPGISSGTLALLTLALSPVVIAIAMWRVRAKEESERFSFLLATAAAILVSYHTLTYDLSLLFPAVLFFFATPCEEYRSQRQEMAFLALLYLIPRFDLLGAWLSPVLWFVIFLRLLFSAHRMKGNWVRPGPTSIVVLSTPLLR